MEAVTRETRRFTADEPFELLDGELVRTVTPRSPGYANGVERLGDRLRAACPAGAEHRVQQPLDRGAASLPESDLAVLTPVGREAHLRERRHPRGAETLLVVEVAVTSAPVDARKARVLAAAGVPVYWILDVPDAVVVEHRDPGAGGYATVRRSGAATPPGSDRAIAAREVAC